MQGECGAAAVMNHIVGLDNECFRGTQAESLSQHSCAAAEGKVEMEFLTSLQSQGRRHLGLLQHGLGKYKDTGSL